MTTSSASTARSRLTPSPPSYAADTSAEAKPNFLSKLLRNASLDAPRARAFFRKAGVQRSNTWDLKEAIEASNASPETFKTVEEDFSSSHRPSDAVRVNICENPGGRSENDDDEDVTSYGPHRSKSSVLGRLTTRRKKAWKVFRDKSSVFSERGCRSHSLETFRKTSAEEQFDEIPDLVEDKTGPAESEVADSSQRLPPPKLSIDPPSPRLIEDDIQQDTSQVLPQADESTLTDADSGHLAIPGKKRNLVRSISLKILKLSPPDEPPDDKDQHSEFLPLPHSSELDAADQISSRPSNKAADKSSLLRRLFTGRSSKMWHSMHSVATEDTSSKPDSYPGGLFASPDETLGQSVLPAQEDSSPKPEEVDSETKHPENLTCDGSSAKSCVGHASLSIDAALGQPILMAPLLAFNPHLKMVSIKVSCVGYSNSFATIFC